MKKIILNWIINFLMTRFGITAEATTSVSVLDETQISELLKHLSKEFNVQLQQYDINVYVERFGNVTMDDLSAIVFARVIA